MISHLGQRPAEQRCGAIHECGVEVSDAALVRVPGDADPLLLGQRGEGRRVVGQGLATERRETFADRMPETSE